MIVLEKPIRSTIYRRDDTKAKKVPSTGIQIANINNYDKLISCCDLFRMLSAILADQINLPVVERLNYSTVGCIVCY